MRQPSSAQPTPPAPSTAALDPEPAPSAAGATETVVRPDPGLARGRWEAPAWAFWAILAAVVIGMAAYVIARQRARARAAGKKP
ncbi:MAG: hypothetical protein JWP97_4801 [Labilithrix sp.]|nr:hypothetical protein [Labilithrix sp.]